MLCAQVCPATARVSCSRIDLQQISRYNIALSQYLHTISLPLYNIYNICNAVQYISLSTISQPLKICPLYLFLPTAVQYHSSYNICPSTISIPQCNIPPSRQYISKISKILVLCTISLHLQYPSRSYITVQGETFYLNPPKPLFFFNPFRTSGT